jgi:peptide-methionine (S)-S-oxide reductase
MASKSRFLVRLPTLLGIACALLLAFEAPPAVAQTPHPPGAEPSSTPEKLAHAAFAGGCFWCMQPPFENLPGVVSTTVGYTGGKTKNPTYEQVSAGETGHAESVEVVYDPSRISYDRLLDVFWHNVDPLTPDAQFCDHGNQYRTAIFYFDDAQRAAAEASKKRLEDSKRFDRPIVTQIVPAGVFYPAEEYHQKYHEKNPVRYRYYRWNCGRDQRLRELWGSEAPPSEGRP